MDEEIFKTFRRYVKENQEKLDIRKSQNIDVSEDQKMFDWKKIHSARVAQICKEIALNERFAFPIKGMENFMDYDENTKTYSFNKEGVNLALICGLYHDIGRFPQIINYHTENDLVSVDHGKLGYDTLIFNNLVEKILKPKECLILYETVYNHNQYAINSALDPTTKYFCGLVRDADKIDIVRAMLEDRIKIKSAPHTPISKNVVEDIVLYGRLVQNSHCRNVNDMVARYFSFRFDINTEYAKKMIINEQLFLNLYKKIDHKKDFDIIFNLNREKKEGSKYAR